MHFIFSASKANNFLWYPPFFEILVSKCAQQSRKNTPQRVFLFNNRKKFLSKKKLKKGSFFDNSKRKIFFILSKNDKTLCEKFCLDCCAHFEPKISKNRRYHKKLFALVVLYEFGSLVLILLKSSFINRLLGSLVLLSLSMQKAQVRLPPEAICFCV